MAHRIQSGFGGSGIQSNEDIAPLNIAAGAEDEAQVRRDSTNLSNSNQPTLLQNAEKFADEIVLSKIERHTIFGRPITRKMSVGIVCALLVITITLIVIIVKAIGNDGEPTANISKREGEQRYQQFLSILESWTGTPILEKGTPEEKALHWLAYDDPMSLDPKTTIDKVVQRFTLSTLYFATNGESWKNDIHFLSFRDECDWNLNEGLNGIECNDEGFATRLHIQARNLQGTLPREIGLLANLTDLSLTGNLLSGELPPTIGLLGKLYSLDLSDNAFSGNIPDRIKRLTNLEILRLDRNKFSGEVPFDNLVGLTSINTMDFSENTFTGIAHDNINDQLDMEEFETLNVSNNNIEGTLPSFLARFDTIKVLDLSMNKFSGSIATSFGRMANLELFDVSDNELIGFLPSFDNPSLMTLRVSSNKLVGNIPTTIGNLDNLNFLELSNNGLDGPLPTEIGNLKYLKTIDLEFNELLGTIPTEIESCSSLEILNLSRNKFENRIPSELGTLSRLKRVDLRNNLLLGSLPTDLQNMSSLTTLYLSGNTFIGDLDSVLCSRPDNYPKWVVLESDCDDPILTCSCCTSCCNGNNQCCTPGSASCNSI